MELYDGITAKMLDMQLDIVSTVETLHCCV